MVWCSLPFRVFIPWMLVVSVSCISCPNLVEKTIAAGETCVHVNYKVDGKYLDTNSKWKDGTYLKPGIDCFPEGRFSYQHTRGDEECDVTINVKGVCSWNPNHCWPGDCTSNLASNCQCRDGFYDTYPIIYFIKRCRWWTQPDLHTCRVAVIDSQGHGTNSTNLGSKTDCNRQQDEFINTQPANLYFVLKSDFTKTIGSNAAYVSVTEIGIVGASISVIKVSLDGSESEILEQDLRYRPICQQNVSATNPVIGGNYHDCEATLNLPQYRVNLKDGERLCADMTATAGGYYKLKDYSGRYQSTATFPETESSKRVCFTFDATKPAHCSEFDSCAGEPMKLSTRLSRSRHVTVYARGWTDPEPGGRSSPSGLNKFRLEVHGVHVGKDSLSVEHAAITELTQEWSASYWSPEKTVTLPEEEEARMYSLILEVHDKAGNVAYARRQVLLDNSSAVELWPSRNLTVVHADPGSNKEWQTDVSKQLCVNWTERFYNTDMYSNNLLKKLSSNTSLEITGHYDQISGVLPVRGTDNVLGITKFEIAWSLNQAPRSTFTEVGDLFAQTTCLQQPLHDGESYDVWIRASDIMNNTQEDSVHVNIDHTGPEVSIRGLLGRWKREGLYVHNDTDLSTMTLVVSAADPHSGLNTIVWTLSTQPLSHDVGRGAVSVQRLDNTTSCSGQAECYCPSLGQCESHRYLVTFTNLVHNHSHQGDHHRDYYITVTATNVAGLPSTDSVKILLDESPPTVGVVWEGLAGEGGAEMDFTSSQVVRVRWHGYQDHESGILLYRVVMGERCLTAVEVDENPDATEVDQGTMASFSFPGEGIYFFSVVAYNGALEPSEVACSDGVTYDTSPPALHNVTMTHARSGQMIGCTQGLQAWLVHTNLTRVALYNTTRCRDICSGPSPGLDVEHLPVSSLHVEDPDASESYCRSLPKMSENSVMVLPSDYIKITWKGHDDESHIEEYYVGLGEDLTESSAPGLLPFTATHGHPSYHVRHLGLGHGDLFFVFLKVTNKAGLSSTLTLGPVLIDVTAPEVTQPLTAAVEDGVLLVTWQEGVFTDPEQPDTVDLDISFRIGHDDGFVTPFRAVSECNVSRCQRDRTAACACYPVKDLHAYDTDYGRSFFFQLHVINAANHITTVNTSSVRLPAYSPPGHAVILDVVSTEALEVATTAVPPGTQFVTPGSTTVSQSSESSSLGPSSMPTASSRPALSTENPEIPSITDRFSNDVDAILQTEELCVAWKGFHHEEEIEVHVGIGTRADEDDVIQFHSAGRRSPVCIPLESAPLYTKLFSLVKATSSGGASVFSSDGFVVLPKADSADFIKVFNGKGCQENNVIGKGVAESSSQMFSVSKNARIPVHAGDFLFIELSPFIPEVVFKNATLLQTTFTGYQIIAETPNVAAEFPNPMASDTSLRIQHCQKDSSVVHLPNKQFTFSWEMTGPITQYVKYFKTELIDTTCLEKAKREEQLLSQKCTLHEEKTSAMAREVTVYHEHLPFRFLQDHTYVSSVSPCFDDTCLPPVTSQPVTYSTSYDVSVKFHQGSVTDMSMRQLTVDIQAAVEPMTLEANICVYVWTISADQSGSVPLADWVVQQSSSCSRIQIMQQVPLKQEGQGTLFVCLRLLFPVESQYPDCFRLLRSPKSNTPEPFHVIELSHDTFRQTDFQSFLSSQQLGSKLHDLYDLDLDFASSDVQLSAVLTGSHGLKVTWFLMTGPHVPDSHDCVGERECITSKAGSGYVTFPRHLTKLRDGNIYYICAVPTEGPEESATGQQLLQQICGDGVVIDDSPPSSGSVAISNSDGGYLAGGGHVTVTWSGFADVETDVPLPDGSVTLNYSLALGSYPGAEDLAPFVQVGQRTTWTFRHLTAASGVTCVATVRAQDRVGHVTEAWSNQVVIDSTPPVVGHVAAGTVTAENFVPGHELPVHWADVEDRESRVFSVEVGVAQREGGDNVIDFQTYQGSSALLTDTSGLVDGHAYVVLLKVTNTAGLTTVKSSAPFVVDSSPPSPGRLWHGDSSAAIVGGYSRRVGVYSVRWAGFTDPHSGLDYYRVALGSSPGHEDVAPFVYVGRQTSYEWRKELQQGTKYYATLEACNRAGLCHVTSSSSLMFDDSPPTPGHVTVGLYGHRNKFLGHNSSVPAQWTGFSDPQTGIQHFTWCVGQTPGTCDVIPSAYTLLSRAAHKAGIALPLATPLFVTVTAVNFVGLRTVSVSDSFVVDPSPPEVMVKPQFVSPRDGSPVNSQWDRSVLHLVWLFSDPESSVVSHTVYLRSQLTGRLVLDPIVLGPETQLTIPLDPTAFLTDGDMHWASVTACNAAHLCVVATSDAILIDSTAPVTATFLSPLRWQREVTDPDSDALTVVDLRWKGFSDAESGISGYEVIAGRRYNGEELSEGRVRVEHNSTTPEQHYRLVIGEQLQAGDILHLALLADNSLHLRSPLVRMAFDCLLDDVEGTSGSLELIRHSCEASYCTQECTCAATGKVCRGSTSPCIELDSSDPDLSRLQVLPYMGTSQGSPSLNSSASPPVTNQQMYSTSAKCLEGGWSLPQSQFPHNLSRFEFSFSLANMSAGEGVFDLQTEPVWYDVGRHMTATHCLPGNRTLKSGHSYVLHVRVWPSRDSHTTFVSSPAIVDHSPPQVKRGRAVLDADSFCSRDIDYVTNETSEVTACWDGVFLDAQSHVIRYQIWMGTSQRASNHHAVIDVGLNATWTFPTTDLEPGTRYYVTVRAWNGAGMHATAHSDGFLVDVTPPVPGVVFPSDHYSNRHAQSSTSTISASWHGFEDEHSGVRSYQVAVFDAESGSVPGSFVDVGIKTRVRLSDLTLTHGHRYKVAVKAVDAAGLESQPAESAAILVDETAPEGVTCTEFSVVENVTLTPSLTPFHLQDTYLADLSLNVTQRGEVMKLDVTASGVDNSLIGHFHVAELKTPLSFHFSPSGEYTARQTFLSPESGDLPFQVVVEGPAGARLSAQLSRCLQMLPSSQQAVTIRQTSAYSISVSSHVRDQESGLQTLMVGLGTTPGGLQIQPWTRVGHSGHLSVSLHVQHATPLHAVVASQNHAGQWARFISAPIVLDRTGPVMSDVTLAFRYEGEGQNNASEVWAEGKWSVQDAESGVEICTCLLDGQGMAQSTLMSADDLNTRSCQWQLNDARHGSEVTMSVTCYNKVQLYTTVTSLPVTIILEPPDLSEVRLASLPNNIFTSPYDQATPQVRSGNSSLQFFWRGVQDPSVTLFYVRFLLNSAPLTEWNLLDAYKTTAVLDRLGAKGTGAEVTAQLMAINERNMTSDILSVKAKLDDTIPLLTGKIATWSQNEHELSLDWRHVFDVNRDVTYSIFGGTEEGYGDVINHVTTKLTHHKGYYAGTVTTVYVSIQAVYDNGLLAIYSDVLHL